MKEKARKIETDKGMKALGAVLIAAVVVCASARNMTLGVDVAHNYPNQATWDCLHREQKADFAIIRCYRSIGSVDTSCPQSVRLAWNAGFKNVDIYIFPCVKCGNATGQIATLYDYVKKNGIVFGLLWIDVEMSLWPLASTSHSQTTRTT